MQNNIRNTNLRFNLDKEQQRRAWEYLQTMDRQDFKSYSQVISLALVDYFDRYYRTQADPYLETREREELFVKQIVDAVENSLKQALPLFLSGLTAGMAQREPQIRASFPAPDFLTADTNLPSYMMFPRFLLDMEINETAKMLYIILLDRARLSQKNEGWSDTDGHVFIYFTIEALAEVLHKSQMTVKTALAVLEKQELIFRKRQGPGQPNRIYVKLPKETIHYTDRFLSLRQTKNCPIDRQDSFPDTDRKLSGNKKEIKKNNLAIRGSKEPLSPYGKFQNVFLSEKELEDIRQTIPDWKDYIERLSGYMASTGKQYQNHAATIISWARQDHPASRQRNYESEEYETL